ncbi:hypothetical protein FFWV33_18245 [Flavobacterium faecale]|uniref:Glycoside hydrolase n=1 Tax=Flavobacterium faecale TaxID=1355330 RepID=A0A2S1LHR7_9FLAO|nr:hypothetical protein [Flavobacterium faecale]AWG23332.1 hypothetical protein FFWV33_18245 [Flavobacterium faecale]
MKKMLLILFFISLSILGLVGYCNSNTFDKKPNKKEITYKGMNLVAPIKGISNTTFDELVANNVNAISLIPYAFVNIDDATVTYNHKRQWWGESTDGIKECIQKAHEHHLKVMIKPHLWVNHQFYTGDLDFKTVAEWEHWEADYQKYILEYAHIAQEEKVDLFCFGTELRNPIAKRPQYWTQLITEIKKIYKGKLTYAANWDDYDSVPFWKQMDYIGVDGYFPLSENKNPTIEELQAGWKKHLAKLESTHKKWNKKILFTEFGYRNSDYAAQEPWKENHDTINNEAQANAFEALFNSVNHQDWYDGGFTWKWYADDYHKNKTIDYTPQDKPAKAVIAKWYK